MSIYTVQYFIDKFSSIPDEQWFVGEFTNEKNPAQHCAYGHCGCEPDGQENEEANTLDRIFRDRDLRVEAVNDGNEKRYARAFMQLPTPKARILAALESFK